VTASRHITRVQEVPMPMAAVFERGEHGVTLILRQGLLAPGAARILQQVLDDATRPVEQSHSGRYDR
jgi:hypothetical protein